MVNTMKKILLVLMAFILLTVTNAEAVDYPKSLNNDDKSILLYAYDDAGIYLDRTSPTLLMWTSGYDILWGQVQTAANYMTKNGKTVIYERHSPKVVMYYHPGKFSKYGEYKIIFDSVEYALPPYIDYRVAYYSLDLGQTWRPFDYNTTEGPEAVYARGYLEGIEEIIKYISQNYNI